VAAFKDALRLEPGLAGACNNLGNVLLGRGEAAEALAYFREAVRLRPGHAESHNHLGRALMDLGRLDEAIACIEEALRLKPDCAEALNNLAIARQFQGRLAEAAEACERSLAVSPKGGAYLTLSQLRRFAAGDAALAAMERLASSGEAMAAEDRAALHFALGKAYDDCGHWAAAFGHFCQGNAIKRGMVAYDEAATLAVMRRMERDFSAEAMRGLQGGGVRSAAPVFILGMPRSGSTLLEQMLSGHPNVFGAGECLDFGVLAGRLLFSDGEVATGRLEAGRLVALGQAYLGGIGEAARAAARFTDKMPGNFLYAGLIHLVFPNAVIIHTRRNAADTCLSCFTQLFRAGHFYSFELGELGRYYAAYRRLMGHWRAVLPESAMIEVDYEALVAAPRPELARILARCGLGWSDSCLDFTGRSRVVRTASATQVRHGLHDRSVGRWRHYADGLTPLLGELDAAAP
jgi:tetratricopeptide (TPR) repeat protein